MLLITADPKAKKKEGTTGLHIGHGKNDCCVETILADSFNFLKTPL